MLVLKAKHINNCSRKWHFLPSTGLIQANNFAISVLLQCIALLGSSQISQLHTLHMRRMLRKTSSIRFCIFSSKNDHFLAASQGSFMLHVMPSPVTQIIYLCHWNIKVTPAILSWRYKCPSSNTKESVGMLREIFPRKTFRFWCGDCVSPLHWRNTF